MIPSLRTARKNLEARGGIEPPIRVLQTLALPLGDRAADSNGPFISRMDSSENTKPANQSLWRRALVRKLNGNLCDQLASTRADTGRREQQSCILPTFWRRAVTVTRYLEQLDAAKSKKCNNAFAIVILPSIEPKATRTGSKADRRRRGR
jgi:hypothetical protein